MTYPQSVTAILLKARYYPGKSFKNAGLGNNRSYVLRGILAAIDLVVDGCRVKVGTGASINIWTDPWIPEVDKAHVTTLMVPELQDTTVCNLLKNYSKEWDQDLIHDIFNAEDTSSILKIPLSLRNETDS